MGVNKLLLQKNKTEDDDGSEYLDTFGLVNHIFNFFEKTNEKKSRKKNLGAPTPPEDEAICLFAGLLANPDMPLSPHGTQCIRGCSVDLLVVFNCCSFEQLADLFRKHKG